MKFSILEKLTEPALFLVVVIGTGHLKCSMHLKATSQNHKMAINVLLDAWDIVLWYFWDKVLKHIPGGEVHVGCYKAKQYPNKIKKRNQILPQFPITSTTFKNREHTFNFPSLFLLIILIFKFFKMFACCWIFIQLFFSLSTNATT